MALKHAVTDTDNNFSINATTRAIKNESVNKTLLIQYDHNSERFSFEIPKEVEGHEMDKCDKIEVHYVNIDAKTQQQSRGVYTVEDARVSEQDGSMLVFSWLIPQTATKYVGSLNFLVRFTCIGDAGELLYVWNTAIFSGIMVSSGIYNSEFVLEEYRDVLEKWKAEIQAFKLLDLQQTEESQASGGVNTWTASFDDGSPEGFKRTFKVRNGKAGADGANGVSGKSAYDIAVEAGTFTGSEEEFAQSLIVPQIFKNGQKLKNFTLTLSGTALYITTSTE